MNSLMFEKLSEDEAKRMLDCVAQYYGYDECQLLTSTNFLVFVQNQRMGGFSWFSLYHCNSSHLVFANCYKNAVFKLFVDLNNGEDFGIGIEVDDSAFKKTINHNDLPMLKFELAMKGFDYE